MDLDLAFFFFSNSDLDADADLDLDDDPDPASALQTCIVTLLESAPIGLKPKLSPLPPFRKILHSPLLWGVTKVLHYL